METDSLITESGFMELNPAEVMGTDADAAKVLLSISATLIMNMVIILRKCIVAICFQNELYLSGRYDEHRAVNSG